MSFIRSFFEWWENKTGTQQKREQLQHHRFDDMLLDVKSQEELSEPNYRRKAPISPNIQENILKSVDDYFKKQRVLTETDQNLKEAINIAQHANFLSDEQRASSLLSLFGEEEAMLAIRAFRWHAGVYCPICGSSKIKRVNTTVGQLVEKYICLSCQEGGHSGEFNDLSEYFENYEMNSIRLWILIGYLRTFLPMSKVAKVLGMNIEQTVRLIDLMTPKESHKNLSKKARRSDSYFS